MTSSRNEFNPKSSLTVEEAENLSGTTLSPADLPVANSLDPHLPLSLYPQLPLPLYCFPMQEDEYGFSRGDDPNDAQVEGYAAGTVDRVPLLLALLLTERNAFEASGPLATLLAQKNLHRWYMAVLLEGCVLRRTALEKSCEDLAANPVQRRLIETHQRLRDLLDPVLLQENLQIGAMLGYGVNAMYPRARVNVLCCSKEVADYWAADPYAAVARAGKALVDDLLNKATGVLMQAGIEVIEGKYLHLPYYQPLCDRRDLRDF